MLIIVTLVPKMNVEKINLLFDGNGQNPRSKKTKKQDNPQPILDIIII